jgi:hypothetical protein
VTDGAPWTETHRWVADRTATARAPRPLGKANLVTAWEVIVTVATRGVVFVHSAPPALCPHVEWALAGVLGMRVSLDWIAQPAAPGALRAELSWSGAVGTAGRVASALRGWALLRFEVTEEPTAVSEGTRYSVTPGLGIFGATIGLHGDLLVPEDRLRTAVARALAAGTPVEDAVDVVLGRAWDDELEPFRRAGEGAPVRWLHQVG